MGEVRLTVKGVDDSNRREKFTAAVGSLAKALGVPLTVKPREKERGEAFVYQAHADLVEKWNAEVGYVLDGVYLGVCEALGLPVVRTFSKAIGVKDENQERPASEALLYHGHPVFNPETGRMIYREDFEKIIRSIERFLNRKLQGADRRIVLDAVALGRILARKLVDLPASEVRKLRLSGMAHEKKEFPWIAESLSRQDRLFGPARPEDRARMREHFNRIASFVDVAEASMADHVTRMTSDIQHTVRRSIIDGVKARSGKAEIAQDLFNRFGAMNRDWQRISETEVVETANNAFLRETVAMADPGEKVYFRRVEMRDNFVCKFCEKIRGMIALWVDHPLPEENIVDPVASVSIWDGKNNVGRKVSDYWVPAGTSHPWCRGSWERYYPPASKGK